MIMPRPSRTKSSQPNIPAVSNPIRTKLKHKRGVWSRDETQEEERQPNNPADLSYTTTELKGRKASWLPDKVQEEERPKRLRSFNEDDSTSP